MEKLIKIACVGADTAGIASLKEFQGELKSLSKEAYAMLRREILDTGFAFPIHVWKDQEGALFMIGGHQRKRVLEELQSEGYEIPPVPIVYVMADTYELAKRRVIQDVAQYGKIEGQGLYQFMLESNLTPGDLAESFKLPDIDLPSFNAEFFMDTVTGNDIDQKDGAKEYSEDDFSKFNHKCPRCGFEFD